MTREIADRARGNGWDVVLFNRGRTEPEPGYQVIKGDIDCMANHVAVLRSVDPDVVVHGIAYTEVHARDYVKVFAGQRAKVFVLSSQDCYEAFFQVNRGRDVAECPIREDARKCIERYYWRQFPGKKQYSDYDKNLVRDVFLCAHADGLLRATVLNLPMVYGPRDPQFAYRHGSIIRRILDKRERLMMGHVEQTGLFTFGYVENVAAAVVHAFDRPITDGKEYNLGEATSRSLRRWAELYFEAAGLALDFCSVPDAALYRDLRLMTMAPRLLPIDTSLYRRETGFSDPVDLGEQIRRTLAWAAGHPEAVGRSPDYQREDQLFAEYSRVLSRLSSEEL